MKRPDHQYIIKGHGAFIKNVADYNSALLNYLVNKNDFNKLQITEIKKKIEIFLETIKQTIQALDHEDSSK